MCKKRKEKKLNMQGKSNMVLGYFIINIHMQLRRRGGLVIILPIPIAYTRFTKKLKTRGSRSHTFIYYWRKEKKKEAPGTYYKGTHTYVLTSTHKRKEAAPQSCPILTPLWTCSMFLDFHPILMLNPMCG